MSKDLLNLTKDEIRVHRPRSPGVPSIEIPIHPQLLNPQITLNPNLPIITFEQAVEEFYDDLKAMAESGNYPEDQVEFWQNTFLKRKPTVEYEGEKPVMRFGLIGEWQSDHSLLPNGFMSDLCVSRNSGGSLYFNSNDPSCKSYIFPDSGGGLVHMTEEKARAFSTKPGKVFEKDKPRGLPIFTYSRHNIDQMPGAVFLRNWALAYMNEALKQIK